MIGRRVLAADYSSLSSSPPTSPQHTRTPTPHTPNGDTPARGDGNKSLDCPQMFRSVLQCSQNCSQVFLKKFNCRTCRTCHNCHNSPPVSRATIVSRATTVPGAAIVPRATIYSTASKAVQMFLSAFNYQTFSSDCNNV